MRQLHISRRKALFALFWCVIAVSLGILLLATVSYVLESSVAVSALLPKIALVLFGAGMYLAIWVIAGLSTKSPGYRVKLWLLTTILIAAIAVSVVGWLTFPPDSEQQHLARFVWAVATSGMLAGGSIGCLVLLRRAERESSE